MVQWRHDVVERDGVRLATYETGPAGDAASASTIVLVSGWPDTHELWTLVAPTLAERHRVITYDPRGYGESDAPDAVAAYRLTELAQDLFAVIDATSPGTPVHVIAHDWGSVQVWEAVTTEGATDRIASFTSVSGPDLDQLGAWSRARLRRPTPRSLGQALSQVASSGYTVLFQTPVLPKALLSVMGFPAVWRAFLHAVEGTPKANITVAPTLRADMFSGLRYYRANIREKLRHPNPGRTDVPVFQIVNTRDIALRPAIYADTYRYAEQLWRIDSPTGHWLPYTRPDFLAETALEFIDAIDSDNPTPQIERLRRRGAPQPFSGKLVVITGSGSGIGRETALRLAAQGAEVVGADLNIDSAQETAQAIKDRGGSAHAYILDVARPDDVAAFAATVKETHGVPDIVINNAGIGLAGHVLDATDAQIRKLVDINLIGVMSGCRAFGKQMIERGLGGQIVNLASAAAFTPQQSLGAYAATKAGVLLFSESLRAELAEHHIGVTAICPGIVDTNIVRTTEFAGGTGEEQNAKREKMDRAYQRRGFTPDKVATDIVRAISKNKAVVPVTIEAKVGYRIYRLTPWLSRLMARANVV